MHSKKVIALKHVHKQACTTFRYNQNQTVTYHLDPVPQF